MKQNYRPIWTTRFDLMKNMSNIQYVGKVNLKLGNETLRMIYVREKTNLILLFPLSIVFIPTFHFMPNFEEIGAPIALVWGIL
jgi:hypothetical protein